MQIRWRQVRNLVLLLLVCLFIANAQGAGISRSIPIQSSGRIVLPSFQIGIKTGSWNFDEYNANVITDSFDISQSWWVGPPPSSNDYSAKMNQVHSLNPGYKALVYRDVSGIYDYWQDEFSVAKSNGWLLRDIAGNYVRSSQFPSHYIVDITNPEYQQWLGAKLKSWLVQYPFFDGVMADNALKYSAGIWSDGASSTPINPSTGAYFTDKQIIDGYAGLLNAIIDAIGPDKLLVPNGIWNGAVWGSWPGDNYRYILSKVPRLNGLMSEGTFRGYNNQWPSETAWLASINLCLWIQNNFLTESNRIFSTGCSADPLPVGATTQQVIMYGFSSLLLCAKHSSQNTISFNIDYSNTVEHGDELLLVQKLRNLDMIRPIGDYYKINSTSVYGRDFIKGKVLVNPADISYTVTLDGSYTTFEGNLISGQLKVLPHTGIILLK